MAMLIIPEIFEFVIFDWIAIILSAKVTKPAWATNELRTFIFPSTASLPKVVFAVPTATFAIRYTSEPTFFHCEDVIWVFCAEVIRPYVSITICETFANEP